MDIPSLPLKSAHPALIRPQHCLHCSLVSPSSSSSSSSSGQSDSEDIKEERLVSGEPIRSRIRGGDLLTEHTFVAHLLLLLSPPSRPSLPPPSPHLLITLTTSPVLLSNPPEPPRSAAMDSFNQPGLWDLSLPPSLPALADDDFIALLQKQFGINHGFPIPMNDVLAKDPTLLGNAALPQTTNIDPKSLSRVPLPRPAAADSPPSDESSPSPSNGYEPSGSRSRRQSTIFGDDEDGREDPSLKRKASEDGFDEEAPTLKSQHTTCASSRRYRYAYLSLCFIESFSNHQEGDVISPQVNWQLQCCECGCSASLPQCS